MLMRRIPTGESGVKFQMTRCWPERQRSGSSWFHVDASRLTPHFGFRSEPAHVHVHDNLATEWISCTFYANEEVSHRGEETFQLARGADGRNPIAIEDTQRQAGCDR